MGGILEEVLAQSFISSRIGLLFLFISLRGVLRELTFFLVSSSLELCLSLNAYISIFLSSITAFFLFCSVLRMDEGERAARNSAHQSQQLWQAWLLSSSVSDAARRLHSRLTQEVWSHTSKDETSGWLNFSESFCYFWYLSRKQLFYYNCAKR